MASKGRSNLNKNNRGISTNFFGNFDPEQEREWIKGKNMIREYFDLQPINTSATRGSITTIEIDKRGDKLGKSTLVFTRAAITGGIPVDWEGPLTIDRITFYYANKPFYEVIGETLVNEILTKLDAQSRTTTGKLEGGNLSNAERITSAASAQTFYVDLRLPWAKMQKNIRMVALPNKIKMDIQWQIQSKVIQDQVSGTVATGGLLSNVFLRTEFIHRMNTDRQREFTEVHTTPLNWKFTTYEYHRRENVPAFAGGGSTYTWRVQLRNIKNDTYQIIATLRNQSDVDQTTSGTLNPLNFLDPTNLTYWLEDNGTQITDYFTLDPFSRYEENQRAYPEHEGTSWNFMMLNLCEPELVMASDDDCFGSRCISKYNNPEFVVSWTSATNALYLDIWGLTHNVMVQHKGDLRKFLA